jgi:multidrug transporter EmrE-like cation transporter
MGAWIFLMVAAFLEVAGDALIRSGLKSKLIFEFIFGGIVLFVYGIFVNAPKRDFGQLLGVYIVLFYIASQLMGYFLFGEAVTQGRLIGGVFIAVGGVCMMIWK